jgi:hypothetical protein
MEPIGSRSLGEGGNQYGSEEEGSQEAGSQEGSQEVEEEVRTLFNR